MLWICRYKAHDSHPKVALLLVEHVRKLAVSAAAHHKVARLAFGASAPVQQDGKDDAVGELHRFPV